MVFTSTEFTSTRIRAYHILIISRVSRTPTPLIKWEQILFQEYHIHIQGLHIIKNISNGSTIYPHQNKSANTPKHGYKYLTISSQHIMGFICMITRLEHANDHIASNGHQTTICVGSRSKLPRTLRTP